MKAHRGTAIAPQQAINAASSSGEAEKAPAHGRQGTGETRGPFTRFP